MFLSRFWYLVLATLAGAAVAAYLIAVGQYNHARGVDLKALLIKDRVQVEALLKLDARTRIDSLQGIAADPDIRAAVASVYGRRTEENARTARTALLAKLRTLNEGLKEVKGDLLAALDDRGRVIAQVGILESVDGLGYGQFPLVEAALRGYLRDDVWRLDDKLYRVAARPVIQGGQYVGAILHGMELTSSLPERLYKKADVRVAFFLGTNVVASYSAPDVPMPSSGELGGPLATTLQSEQFRNEGRTEVVSIGERYSGIYSKITGEAAENGAGYVISRPRVAVVDPVGFALNATTEATGTVPWPLLAGGVFLAFLIGLGLVFLERDNPLSKLRKGIAALAGKEQDRIDITRLRGPYRKLATAINEAIDKAVEATVASAPPKRREADLDAILGPTPGSAAAASPFAFGSMEAGADLVPSAPPPSPTAATVAMPKGPIAPPIAAPQTRPGSLPPVTAPPPVVVPATPAAGGAARPLPPVPAPPRAPGGPPSAPSMLAAAPPAPPPVLAPPVREGLVGKSTMVGIPSSKPDEEESATVVSRVPDELLSAVAAGDPPSASSGPSEEEHFRTVFGEFVEAKKKCGEAVDSLTFEKFLVTLRKNKETLVQRYQCKSVRFQVYVKEGKAALRATPVKG